MYSYLKPFEETKNCYFVHVNLKPKTLYINFYKNDASLEEIQNVDNCIELMKIQKKKSKKRINVNKCSGRTFFSKQLLTNIFDGELESFKTQIPGKIECKTSKLKSFIEINCFINKSEIELFYKLAKENHYFTNDPDTEHIKPGLEFFNFDTFVK
jgi:hypothetical protein